MSPLTLFCHLPNSVLCPAIPRLTRLDSPIGSINSSRDHSRLNAYKRECLRGFARAHRKSRYNISPSFFSFTSLGMSPCEGNACGIFRDHRFFPVVSRRADVACTGALIVASGAVPCLMVPYTECCVAAKVLWWNFSVLDVVAVVAPFVGSSPSPFGDLVEYLFLWYFVAGSGSRPTRCGGLWMFFGSHSVSALLYNDCRCISLWRI